LKKRGLDGPFFVAQNSASALQKNWRNSSISSFSHIASTAYPPLAQGGNLRAIG
jgi:hypothetical protein